MENQKPGPRLKRNQDFDKQRGLWTKSYDVRDQKMY